MIALAIIGGILLLLLLLLWCKVGVVLSFDEGFALSIHYLFLRFHPLKEGEDEEEEPQKAPEKAGKKGQKKEKATPGETVQKLKSTTDLVLDVLAAAKKPLKKLLSRLDFKSLTFTMVVATGDAGETGILYGRIMAGASALLPALEQFIHFRKKKIQITPDFQGEELTFSGKVCIRARVIYLLAAGLGFFIEFIKRKKER